MFSAAMLTSSGLSFHQLFCLTLSLQLLLPLPSHRRTPTLARVSPGTLLVGFITTNNVCYSKVLNPGQMFVVPRGLVHFQMNVGKGKALAYTAFNSHLPASAILSNTMFGPKPPMPNDVLMKSFRVEDAALINTIRSKFGS